MRLENKLCDTCKVNRVYDVCDRKHGMCDEVIGCPHYIPTDFFYRGGEPWCKGSSWGYSYSPAGVKNEDIVKAVKGKEMDNELIKCVSETGVLTKEMYDCLYGIIQEGLAKNEQNSCYCRHNPDDYYKCLAENVNICIGRFFAYIQRMENNGLLFWDDFIKELEKNKAMHNYRNITVTYKDSNIQMKQEFFSEEGTIIVKKKANKIIFEHGWTRYTSGEKDKKNCVIEILKNQVNNIEKSKADWITSIRRYTLTFKNKQKIYFDMY